LSKRNLICIFLVTATFVVYLQILDHEFLNYDDNQYVTENPQVQTDFTRESIFWAFTASYASNWHPVTWLSHMLDYQLYGLNPRGHHLTNLLLHTANALLLFLVLVRMTGAVWQSGFVAAMFTLHPLNVESVAWVAERKNVLSTLFWLLTLWAYIRYTEKSGIKRYSLIILFFALGLMSKPMLVTLPFVLLLMDYWPLGRWRLQETTATLPATQTSNGNQRSGVLQLIGEKIPLLLLVVGSCLTTIKFQESGGALESLHYNSLSSRITNALVSYLEYIKHMLCPRELAVFYPHPLDALPVWKGVLCGIALVGITIWVVRQVCQAPYLAVGWFWYLGTLMPVIGLVQVGEQAMADRYTYIPLIGLFIAVAWGLPELLANWRYRNRALFISTALLIPVLMTLTWQQTSHWKNSITLFKRAVAVTDTKYPGFVVVHNNLGIALSQEKQFQEAIANFREAIRLQPNYAEAHNNLASTLGDQRKFIEALAHFQEALRLKPNYAEAHNNLGNTLSAMMNFEKAVAHYKEAIRIQPDYSEAHFNLGNTLGKQKEFEKAIAHYKEAIKLQPKFSRAHNNLGSTLFQQGKFTESISHFETAIALDPGYVEAHNNLGSALGQQGQFEEARAHFDMALELDPGYSNAHKNLAAVLSILAKSKNPSEISK
jgi:protein O-mannosyl-transferase